MGNPQLIERLANIAPRNTEVVEVGIGQRFTIAEGLADRGRSVMGVDVVPLELPKSIDFVRDDITSPTLEIYSDASLIYGLRCPPELQRPLVELSATVGASCRFTTLGFESSIIPTTTKTCDGVSLHAPSENPTANRFSEPF
ncbi:MAG: UPF0146 family protein [Halobacteriaceae archaeon]